MMVYETTSNDAPNPYSNAQFGQQGALGGILSVPTYQETLGAINRRWAVEKAIQNCGGLGVEAAALRYLAFVETGSFGESAP